MSTGVVVVMVLRSLDRGNARPNVMSDIEVIYGPQRLGFIAFVRFMVPRFRFADRIHRAAFQILLSVCIVVIKALSPQADVSIYD